MAAKNSLIMCERSGAFRALDSAEHTSELSLCATSWSCCLAHVGAQHGLLAAGTLAGRGEQQDPALKSAIQQGPCVLEEVNC